MLLRSLNLFFLASDDKTDLKAIIQLILGAATNDESIKLREIALKTFDSIAEANLQDKLNVVASYAMPILIEIAKHKSEDEKKLRQMSFWILSRIAPYAINDESLRFFTRSLNDRTDDIRRAVICIFENLIKLSDQALKRRIAQLSLPSLCGALNDPIIRVRATIALGGLEGNMHLEQHLFYMSDWTTKRVNGPALPFAMSQVNNMAIRRRRNGRSGCRKVLLNKTM